MIYLCIIKVRMCNRKFWFLKCILFKITLCHNDEAEVTLFFLSSIR